MNIFLRKQILLQWLFLLAVPLIGSAQIVVKDTIFESQVYQTTFTSSPNDPTLFQPPSNGNLNWGEVSSFNYQLSYTPDSAFVGTDEFRYYIWQSNGPAPSFTQLIYKITVLPSMVTAEHDHLTTAYEQPLTIDVKSNDFSSTGVLNLKTIPSVNNGTAVFTADGEQIIFTPAAGFSGIAYLDYVVCDDIGSCDNGTVIVNVLENAPNQTDTMQVFATKNTAQPIFVPSAYVLTQSPAEGIYDESGDMPIYTPNTDYVGTDYIGYDYMGMDKVVEVIVLDVERNQFAFDDEIFMTPYEGEIEINVLTNDVFGTNTSCVNLNTGAQYGNVTYTPQADGKGIFRYTPPAGFSGVDWFTYKSCPPQNPGNTEIAKVLVFVSNYEPSQATFNMSTPKLTPLVVGYSVPISTYEFEVVEGGDLGTTTFLEGNVDTTIYGRQVTGYNLIIYTPNDNVDSGLDEIELEYCVLVNGNCSYTKTVKIDIEILDIGDGSGPMCFDDCIWAGDANFDGIVNMQDLLAIGLSMGEVGKPRSDVNLTEWYGQYGEDWNSPFQSLPIDLKHPDTDGDSLITAQDTLAISNFYGNAHSMTAAMIPYYEDEIVLEGNLFADPGDLVEMKMILGNPNDPAEDIYGFTFPFDYNPDIITPSSVSVEYGTNSWLVYNSPVLHMQRNDLQGLLESGFTRTNQISATGHGEIGTLRFVINDDIDGIRDDDGEINLQVGGGTSTVMNSSGTSYGMRIGGANIRIRLKSEEETQPLSADQLKIYPNPTQQNFINVHLNGRRDIERVRVFDMRGRMMYDADQVLSNHLQVPTGNLHNGMYVVSVVTADGLLTKKFEVLR
jgi:hypothetical protein